MVTLLNPHEQFHHEYAALNNDVWPGVDGSPFEARNGDIIMVMDTGKIYMWSEDDVDWLEFSASSGSSDDEGETCSVTFENSAKGTAYHVSDGNLFDIEVEYGSPVTVKVPVGYELPAGAIRGTDRNVEPTLTGEYEFVGDGDYIHFLGDCTLVYAGVKDE